MSKIIGLKNLRENMSAYVAQVEKGKSFTVVKKSKPIFKIIPVDEWGDEGVWESVADFTKIRKGGVPIDEVIAALKRLIKEDKKKK